MKAWRILQNPGVKGLLLAQLLGRLPLGMNTVALLLHTQQATGDIALAAGVSGMMAAAQAAGGPVLARLLPRVGGRATLIICTLISSGTLVLFAIAPITSAPILLTVSALAGFTVPPTSTIARVLYPDLVPGQDVRALYSLDSTSQEVIWILGPLVVAVVAGAFSTSAALLLCAGVLVTGQAFFSANRRVAAFRPGPAMRPLGGVLANCGFLLVMSVTVGLAGSVSAVEVAAVAYAGEDVALVGVIIGSLAVGSMVGGVTLGMRTMGKAALTIMTVGCTISMLLSAAVAPVLPLLILALSIAGTAHAPSFSIAYSLVGRLVAPEAQPEAFSWLVSGARIGAAGGALTSGLVTHLGGAPAGFACAAAFVVISVMASIALLRVRGRENK